MTPIDFTSHTKPVGYFLAAGAVVATLAALAAIWTWAARPMEVVQGRLGSPASLPSVLSHSVGEFFSRVDPSIQDHVEPLTSDDPAWWWPAHVGNAALAFHCAPQTSQDTRQSVMVWTDSTYNVVAYGAALQGEKLPTFAAALADANEPAYKRPVYAAAQGLHVVAAEKNHALKTGDTRLGCIPSYTD